MKKGFTFLLIDDDQEDQELFCIAVESIDPAITCVFCSSAQEALLMLRQPEAIVPDLVFLDLNMPRMTGKECLVEMKKDPKLTDLPVVIYSTSSNQSDREETKRLGAIDFITKAGHFSELISEIKTCMAKHLTPLSQ